MPSSLVLIATSLTAIAESLPKQRDYPQLRHR
jgi:hypothetical protein